MDQQPVPLSLSGDASGSVSWDGSANATLSVTVADDSHSHSNYITSNANDNVTGHTEWQDNYEIRLGNGADFRMWHNGSNTYFRNYLHADGDFYWQGEGTGGVNHNLISMHNDVATPYVRLYYDSAVVLETVSGGVNIAGNTAWHAGNDGTGSGLDADLLDGVQGSSLRSDASDTHSGTLTLDVVQVGNELRLPNNTSVTDVSLTGTSDQDTGFNWSGSGAVNYISNGVLYYNLNNVWHSGNDGSGSGLDADLLDGLHASSFVRSDADATKTGALIMSGVGSNVAPSADEVRLTGYGMIGNRATMYITNPGGDVQVGVGSIHNNNPAFTFGSANTSHHPLSMAGQLDMNNNDIVGVDQIIHEGDSNTYMQFHAADQWRVVTGGTERLEVNGSQIYATREFRCTQNVIAYYSDERLKTKTANLDNAIDKVRSLNAFYYVENALAKEQGFDSGDKQQVALSAQEVQEVLPEVVTLAPFDMEVDDETGETYSKSGENYLTVDYAKMVPLLVQAIKEQQEQIDFLKYKLKV